MSEQPFHRWIKSLDEIEATLKRAKRRETVMLITIGALIGLLLCAWGIT